jgi:chromosome segregation ATPase
MSESLWNSGAVEEAQQEQPAQEHTSDAAADSADVTSSMDEFSALEERILRAVNLVKQERHSRAEAEARAAKVEEQLRETVPLAENLQKEVVALRGERDQVRQRVERLLAQLDALEL